MKLFGKKEVKSSCCKGNYTTETMQQAEQDKGQKGIKILGSGCAKCHALEQATRQAIVDMDLDDEIQHVTDFAQIAAYGVMSTPALVMNGKVITYGKVLTVEEVKSLIEANL